MSSQATHPDRMYNNQQSPPLLLSTQPSSRGSRPVEGSLLDKLINDKLFPENPPKPEDFDKNVADVKAKLPK